MTIHHHNALADIIYKALSHHHPCVLKEQCVFNDGKCPGDVFHPYFILHGRSAYFDNSVCSTTQPALFIYFLYWGGCCSWRVS